MCVLCVYSILGRTPLAVCWNWFSIAFIRVEQVDREMNRLLYIYVSPFFFLSFFIAAWAHLDLLRSSSSFHLVSPPSSQLSSLTFWIWTRSFVEQAHNSWFIRVEERVERGVKVRMSCLARGCYNTEPIATRYYIINTNYKWLDRKLPGERLNSMLFNTIRTETSWLRSAASVLNNVYYVQTL